jgi:phage/plasmid-like protein (TIGR03299 family)
MLATANFTRKRKNMAHNLEVFGSEVAFALRGTPAWHNLANAIFEQDADITTSDMMDAAKLSGWDIGLEPVVIPAGYRTSGESFMVTRTNPFDGGKDILSIVGDRYKVFQNEALADFGDALHDGGARPESAGSIKGGKQVFLTYELDKSIILDPKGIADETKSYLMLTTSHDGSASVQALITPVRVVCQNTLNMALAGAKQSFKVRHTQKVDGRIAEARQTIGLAFQHMDEFDKMANELYQRSITNQQFDSIVDALYPADDKASKSAITMRDNKVDLIRALYLNAPTQEGIRGTAWGALNALTERIDYFRNARGGNVEGVASAASGLEAGVNAEKSRILKAVMELTA